MRFLDTSRIRTRFDERVLAADGTELSVDLYLPAEPGRYPVLLNRTAADNNRSGRHGISLAPADRWKALAAQGYIVAAADVRGRGDSDGEFVPFQHEALDGAATLQWLRQLNESNGKIGVFGSGYGAFCAWAAAGEDGDVNAIVSISPFAAVGEGLLHNGGAVRLDWLFWMHLIGGRTVQPANVPRWQDIHKHLPLSAMDKALGRNDIWWQEWLQHLDPNDPYWAPINLADQIKTLNTPGLHITGWWDGQLAGARYFYQAAKKSKAEQQLIIGPWNTEATRRPQAQVGGFDFGPRSLIDMDETLTHFFDQQLKTTLQNNDSSNQPVGSRLFITGRNEWVSTEQWPGENPNRDSETLTFYLSAQWGANTRRGDGQLNREPIDRNDPDSLQVPNTITHNSERPVEFQPGFNSFASGANAQGFVLDQSHITSRDEALVYTSEPLAETRTIIGRPRITLTVKTDAADADIFVLLSDSFPLGSRDLHLCHGALRLATVDQFVRGKTVTFTIDLNDIAHDFLAGHQIRLTIIPSLYPLYACNTHDVNYHHASSKQVAEIGFNHADNHRSLLTLPLLNKKEWGS